MAQISLRLNAEVLAVRKSGGAYSLEVEFRLPINHPDWTDCESVTRIEIPLPKSCLEAATQLLEDGTTEASIRLTSGEER